MKEQLPAIEKIVVPLDGSDLAEAALPVATAVATAADAHLDLVTVALTYDVPLDTQMDTLTQAALHRAEAAIRATHPRVARTILAGTPAEELSNHARNSDADLIVMATHGRSGLRKLILGSVADKLITLSTVPVLLVRAKNDGPVELPLDETKFKRIILPLDGRESAPAAVPLALSVAKLFSAETVLLFANEDGTSEAAERQLRVFVGVFEQQDLVVSQQVERGRPSEVIVETTREGDLVIMSSLSATGVARGSHRGSVADHVIKNADAPVLVVAPKGYLGTAIE